MDVTMLLNNAGDELVLTALPPLSTLVARADRRQRRRRAVAIAGLVSAVAVTLPLARDLIRRPASRTSFSQSVQVSFAHLRLTGFTTAYPQPELYWDGVADYDQHRSQTTDGNHRYVGDEVYEAATLYDGPYKEQEGMVPAGISWVRRTISDPLSWRAFPAHHLDPGALAHQMTADGVHLTKGPTSIIDGTPVTEYDGEVPDELSSHDPYLDARSISLFLDQAGIARRVIYRSADPRTQIDYSTFVLDISALNEPAQLLPVPEARTIMDLTPAMTARLREACPREQAKWAPYPTSRTAREYIRNVCTFIPGNTYASYPFTTPGPSTAP